jgi:8-oxo-dGTP pyrophosphatase MutT (NUDIX family)
MTDPTDRTDTVVVRDGVVSLFVEGTPKFPANPPYLFGEDYAMGLRVFRICCVDLFLVCEERVALFLRQQLPWADLWVAGGKMNPGESRTTTAIRKGREELGLDLSSNSFELLGIFDYDWSTSAQGVPCSVEVSTLVVEITREQAESIILNEEYAGMQWIEPVEVLTAGDGTYHPAIKRLFKIYDSQVYKEIARLRESYNL